MDPLKPEEYSATVVMSMYMTIVAESIETNESVKLEERIMFLAALLFLIFKWLHAYCLRQAISPVIFQIGKFSNIAILFITMYATDTRAILPYWMFSSPS